MEGSMARLLCAPCVSAEQNSLYNNPPLDPPCSCLTCSPSTPFASSQHPPCDYSGCSPEPAPPPKEKTRAPDRNPIPRNQRVSRKMRAMGVKELLTFRMAVYLSLDVNVSRSFPPEVLLPDTVIKLILDRFALLETMETLQELVKERTLLVSHVARLWEKVVELRGVFEEMRARAKAKARERDAARRALKKKEKAEEAERVSADSEVSTAASKRVVGKTGKGPSASPLDRFPSPVAEPVGSTLMEWDPNSSMGTVRYSDPSTGLPLEGSKSSRKRSPSTTSINPRPRVRTRKNKENVQ
ncbi:hypothetical protein LXA43DRAFT_1054118 [Ganoderma leucocontextum]|nr:hypothetical protein LXA43DRAFT_1054118 [Ganoderma leucocontextum]